MLTLTTMMLAPALAGPHHDHDRGGAHDRYEDNRGRDHRTGDRGRGNAYGRDAFVEVDNRYAVPVRLLVDNRVVGHIAPHGKTTFRVDTGRHRLELQTLDSVRLELDHTWLSKRERTRMVARAPMTRVDLRNQGALPLFVQGPGVGLWVQPYGTTTTYVRSGPVDLVASVQGRRGALRRVDTVHLFAHANRVNTTGIGVAPPPVAYQPPPAPYGRVAYRRR